MTSETKAPTLPAVTKPRSHWLGLAIPGTKAHMTITWMGCPSEDKILEIERDVYHLQTELSGIVYDPAYTGKMEIVFLDEWETLGKPDDIKAGKGVEVRRCAITDPRLVEMIHAFHLRWYHHEAGEDEARKTKIRFHVSVSSKITREELAALKRVPLDGDSVVWHR